MSLSIVHSRAQVGVEAPAVTVEVHLANGLPSLTMVGLPEAAVKESKDRVRSAIINSGLQFPARRITLNLAPADLPKDGGHGLDNGIDITPVSHHYYGHNGLSLAVPCVNSQLPMRSIGVR
ncbi:Competence protein ComM [Pseudomonas sp. ACN5]|nr:Competence protein ComM [Pseudomonas sp. ACN5]